VVVTGESASKFDGLPALRAAVEMTKRDTSYLAAVLVVQRASDYLILSAGAPHMLASDEPRRRAFVQGGLDKLIRSTTIAAMSVLRVVGLERRFATAVFARGGRASAAGPSERCAVASRGAEGQPPAAGWGGGSFKLPLRGRRGLVRMVSLETGLLEQEQAEEAESQSLAERMRFTRKVSSKPAFKPHPPLSLLPPVEIHLRF